MEHATLTPFLTTDRDGRLSTRRNAFRLTVFLALGTAFLTVVLATDSPRRRADRTVPARFEDLSPLLAASVAKFKLPGMAAAIVEGNRITAIGVAGLRCRGQAEKLTVDDLFHIGSDTKSMTAMVVAMLVEEGKLRWTSSPADILPKDGVSTIDPAWKRVTLEELLTHRAGIRANLDLAGLLLIRVLGESPQKERRDVCRAVLRKPSEKEPGKGFLLFQHRLCDRRRHGGDGGRQAVGGVDARAAVPAARNGQRRLRSAGNGSAQIGKARGKKNGIATVCRGACRAATRATALPCRRVGTPTIQLYGPAGTVHVSLGDWAKYASFHLEGERGIAVIPPGAKRPLLSVESIRRLHAPSGDTIPPGNSHYAMGWGVSKIAKTGEPGSDPLRQQRSLARRDRSLPAAECCHPGRHQPGRRTRSASLQRIDADPPRPPSSALNLLAVLIDQDGVAPVPIEILEAVMRCDEGRHDQLREPVAFECL